MNAAEKAQEKAKLRQEELENMRRAVVAVIPENDKELIGVGAGRQISLNPFVPPAETPQTPHLESQPGSKIDQNEIEACGREPAPHQGGQSWRLSGLRPIRLGKRSLMKLSAGCD